MKPEAGFVERGKGENDEKRPLEQQNPRGERDERFVFPIKDEILTKELLKSGFEISFPLSYCLSKKCAQRVSSVHQKHHLSESESGFGL